MVIAPGVYLNYYGGGYPYYAVPAYYRSSVACCSPVAVDYSGYTSPPQVVETGPVPRPNDGGPATTAPPLAVPTPVTPPLPGPNPVAYRPIKKIEYPAYGESPARVRQATAEPLLVKIVTAQ